MADRREGRAAAETFGVVARNRDGVTEDPLSRHVDRKLGRDKLRQFIDDVAVHPIVLRERRLGGVDIEAGPLPNCQLSGSSGTASPRGLVSGQTTIMPSSAARRRYSPFSMTRMGAGQTGKVP